MIRLCPGCECQPVLPPGAQTLLCTYTSDSPFVCCSDCQACSSPAAFWPRVKVRVTSISRKWPKASKVLLYPSASVAKAFPDSYRAVAAIVTLSKTRHTSRFRMSAPFLQTSECNCNPGENHSQFEHYLLLLSCEAESGRRD